MIASMMLAGIPVRDQDVLELARLLRETDFEEVAERLENAYDAETKVLALTISERESILRALEDCPDGLGELRATLLRERPRGPRRRAAAREPARASRGTRVHRSPRRLGDTPGLWTQNRAGASAEAKGLVDERRSRTSRAGLWRPRFPFLLGTMGCRPGDPPCCNRESAGVSDRLLNAQEVAELLHVPVSWVRESTRAGAIPHVQLGRYKRYREADVAKWLESCSQPGRTIALRRDVA